MLKTYVGEQKASSTNGACVEKTGYPHVEN
jgi:hypothetical protein